MLTDNQRAFVELVEDDGTARETLEGLNEYLSMMTGWSDVDAWGVEATAYECWRLVGEAYSFGYVPGHYGPAEVLQKYLQLDEGDDE